MSSLAQPVDRAVRMRLALRLEAFSIAWMVVEAGSSVIAGIAARSLLLIAFGADSLIELASAAVLYWRLQREASGLLDEDAIEAVERKAARIGGYLLYALAAYVLAQSAYGLLRHHSAKPSWWGIAIAIIAAVGMPFLAKRKLRVADEIGSQALRADAMESFTCGYLSWILLIGLVATAILHFWWLDSVAAMFVMPFLLREAKETLSGECACQKQN